MACCSYIEGLPASLYWIDVNFDTHGIHTQWVGFVTKADGTASYRVTWCIEMVWLTASVGFLCLAIDLRVRNGRGMMYFHVFPKSG